MHLISPLCSGVRGCESGTAEIFQRASGTRANYWLGNGGFEGGGAVTSGADVTLDANGGAQVYVNEYVDVVCKNSSGVEVRRFTAGYAATAVEVDSASFTGTPYAGGASAVSEPITLAAVLAKWITSAGSPDWKVLVGGVATDLQDAFSGGLGPTLINVTSSAYGAVGDGITDDRTAIAAAITAAAAVNGVVFFPPGTYRFTAGITVPYDVSLLGCGANASILAPSHATEDAVTVTGNAAARRWTSIAGLAILPGAAHAGSLVRSSGADILHLRITECVLGNSDANGALIDLSFSLTSASSLHVEDCDLVSGSSGQADCRAVPATFLDCRLSGAFCAINGETLNVERCYFDNSAVSGAGASAALTNKCIGTISTNALTYRIRDCTFTAPATNTVAAMALNADAQDINAATVIEESGNTFGANVFAYYSRCGTTSKGCRVWLGSRLGRRKEATNNDAIVDFSQDALDYETLVIKRSTSTDQTVRSSSGNLQLPDGNPLTVMVWNESGGNIAAETFSFLGAGAAVAITDNLSATVRLQSMQVESAIGLYALAPVVATGDPN